MMTTAQEGTGPLQPEVVGIDPEETVDSSQGAAAPKKEHRDGTRIDAVEEADASAGSSEPMPGTEADDTERTESIEQPAKLLRIGSMVKQLLDEVRHAPLDEAGRTRLREIYDQSIHELSDGLSPDLVAELERVTIPFDSSAPSEAELRIAQAQLVGWLEGLFHGIQATWWPSRWPLVPSSTRCVSKRCHRVQGHLHQRAPGRTCRAQPPCIRVTARARAMVRTTPL